MFVLVIFELLIISRGGIHEVELLQFLDVFREGLVVES